MIVDMINVTIFFNKNETLFKIKGVYMYLSTGLL